MYFCYGVIRMETAAENVREISQSKEQREKILEKFKQNLRDLQDNNKSFNMHIIKVPEEESKIETEKQFEEITTKNFPNLMKNIDLQIQGAQQTPSRVNTKKNTPRHIIVKPEIK